MRDEQLVHTASWTWLSRQHQPVTTIQDQAKINQCHNCIKDMKDTCHDVAELWKGVSVLRGRSLVTYTAFPLKVQASLCSIVHCCPAATCTGSSKKGNPWSRLPRKIDTPANRSFRSC
eukprot:6113629-Amphidinium_carterae.1